MNPHERLHIPSDAGYHENHLEAEGVHEVYQDEGLPSSFNIEPMLAPNSLVGDRDDIIVSPKKKQQARKKKVTWRSLVRRKQLDPDFEYD